MDVGECWVFRGDLEHEIFWHGEGQGERIHLVFDIHTRHEPVGGERETWHHPHRLTSVKEADNVAVPA